MAEKAIVHTISKEEGKRSIETLKVREETLEYLRKKGIKTIKDFVDKQDKIPKKYRGNVYAYLIFGMEDQIDDLTSQLTDLRSGFGQGVFLYFLFGILGLGNTQIAKVNVQFGLKKKTEN